MSIGEESTQQEDSGWMDPEHDACGDTLVAENEESSLGTILRPRELLSETSVQ
eukprot:SAG11_NODE_408_length_9704_cov_6.496774_4_plen_53_part_00